MCKIILLVTGIVAFLAGVCFADTTIEFSLMGGIGYFHALGDWTTHRFAPGVDQFQGRYTLSPEFEVKINDIGIGLFYSYTRLSAVDWEDYARSQGDDLYASGALGQLGGVVRYYPVNTERHAVNIEGGLSHVWLTGNEKYRGFDYEYDFVQSGLGFLMGAGYQYSFNERLSLTLPVRFLWKPEGIRYPEGNTYDVLGLLLMPGLKLTF